jgi:hypothetical protein
MWSSRRSRALTSGPTSGRFTLTPAGGGGGGVQRKLVSTALPRSVGDVRRACDSAATTPGTDKMPARSAG